MMAARRPMVPPELAREASRVDQADRQTLAVAPLVRTAVKGEPEDQAVEAAAQAGRPEEAADPGEAAGPVRQVAAERRARVERAAALVRAAPRVRVVKEERRAKVERAAAPAQAARAEQRAAPRVQVQGGPLPRVEREAVPVRAALVEQRAALVEQRAAQVEQQEAPGVREAQEGEPLARAAAGTMLAHHQRRPPSLSTPSPRSLHRRTRSRRSFTSTSCTMTPTSSTRH
jgi:hypothetical protein